MKIALLFVQPTVILLAKELFTKVPPALITKFATLAVVVTVTVCPEAIVTPSVQPGTTPPTQVVAVFQSPVAAETIFEEVVKTPELFTPI